MTDIDAILKERGGRYGSFGHVADTYRSLMHSYEIGMRRGNQGLSRPADADVAVHMILMKIARIACGNPNHLDNWDDIQGYAKLVADRLRGQK